MHMDPVLVAPASYCASKVDWFSSGCEDGFLSYDLATGTVQGFWAGCAALVKRRKVDDGPVVPDSAPAFDVICLLGFASKHIAEAERDYRHYFGDEKGD